MHRQLDTATKWHKMGFKLYWRWKSTSKKVGRPPIDQNIRDLIRRMACENPTWGALHIQSELRLLGYHVAQATVTKYMPKTRKPPSQTWRTFLENHAPKPRPIQPPSEGNVVAMPYVGGLHRGYRRAA